MEHMEDWASLCLCLGHQSGVLADKIPACLVKLHFVDDMVKFDGLHVVHVEAKASVVIDEVHLSQRGSSRRRYERGFGW